MCIDTDFLWLTVDTSSKHLLYFHKNVYELFRREKIEENLR